MRQKLSEIKDFLVHLRLHYQFFILSGPFLLGGIFSPKTNLLQFSIYFFIIHTFLFGGVTAYNSYWDKDEGPIGGLLHPPKMKSWMLIASWFFQGAGLFVAFYSGIIFSILYLVSMLFFWLYSSPHARWKGKPLLSLIAIGIATVMCSVFLGYISFGGNMIHPALLLGAFGATMLILSLYPMSQIYQVGEDTKRGDTTFAVAYGLKGIQKIFTIQFPIGICLLVISFWSLSRLISLLVLVIGLTVGAIIFTMLRKLTADRSEYRNVMRIKYLGGLIFAFTMLSLIFML